MATAVVNWTPSNGTTYEIWYAKLSVVGTTSLPPTSGWTQATGSPFDSSLGVASIPGLDDNTIYRIAARIDCTGPDSDWVSISDYKLVCPGLGVVANPTDSNPGASVTATITILNYIEFEAIAPTITVAIRKTSGVTIEQSHQFTAPYPNSVLTWTFPSLVNSTQYTVILTVQDSIASSTVSCGTQTVTTSSAVIVPPPFCFSPDFTLSAISKDTVDVTVTSTILTGDTFDISIDGGLTYSFLNVATPTFQVFGLTPATMYQIVVRRNCGAGGSNASTSQTFTTNAATIVGTVSMNSSVNLRGQFTSGDLYLLFTFPAPTPFPITLYFGFTFETSCGPCAGGVCYYSNGYSMFTPVSGRANGLCAGTLANGATYYGNSHPESPFVVNIPQGVTTYNSGTSIRTTTSTVPYSPSFDRQWLNNGTGTIPAARGYVDLFVKANSPSGYSTALTIAPGLNINIPTLHNV